MKISRVGVDLAKSVFQLHGMNWEGMNRQFKALFATPSFKYAWAIRGEFYGEEFREMVEQSSVVEYKFR